jgi:CRP-like cAMP-binding protein
MGIGELGREYADGEVIIRQGEKGTHMYEILSGEVEVTQDKEGTDVLLAVLGKGEFFGEMALFDPEFRSATIRARGKARVLTVDKRILMRRISEDPSLALRLLEKMSRRIRRLDEEVVRLRKQE